MKADLTLLAINAAAIGSIHTLVGPDHYLPFIVLSRARGWSRAKTAWITIGCGLGHVASSIVIGLIGYGFGAGLKHFAAIENYRGIIATWTLLGFGLCYAAWGLRRARKTGSCGHNHLHGGAFHAHDHIHDPDTGDKIDLTPWILFVIFAFGPCEPLIPLFIYPAATSGWAAAFIVAVAFSVATLAVMLSVVMAASFGLERFPFKNWGRYSHALAGASIAVTAIAMMVFDL